MVPRGLPEAPKATCFLIHMLCLVTSVVSDSVSPWTSAHQAPLGGSPWDSPDENIGVGCISFSRGSSQPKDWTHASCIASGFFIAEPPRKPPPSYSYSATEDALVQSVLLITWGHMSRSEPILWPVNTKLFHQPNLSSSRFYLFNIMKYICRHCPGMGVEACEGRKKG